jgi:uncharacterized membrane protein YheB (UPF0754 family)
MDQQTIIAGLVTIGVGAVSGGITNAVAVWMLFNPHEPRGVGPFRLQGAIPKNKGRLAKAIGRTVGERLLTTEDLAQRLAAPSVREAFDAALGRILDEVLERERGPLREHLTPELLATLDESLAGLGPRVADRVAAYAGGDDFREHAARWIERLRAEVADRPLGDALTADRRDAIRAKLEAWLDRLAQDDDLERTLRDWIDAQLARLGEDEQPLIERLPPGIVGAIEHAIADYIPLALERLGDVLADPAARAQVQTALRLAFDHSIRDMLLHERLLARLVVTDRTIERLIDGFEREGFERFADSLAAPDMKEQVTRAVGDAVQSFLRQPLGERLRGLDPERRAALRTTLGDWLVRAAREPATRAALGRAVDRLLDTVERRTWGEVLDVVPPERVARFAGDVLADERGRRWVEEAAGHVAQALLARPIGRPAAWLGAETTASLRQAASDAAWRGLQTQVPLVVAQLGVREMVEQKVLGFSTHRMEEIVREVSQRELDLIVRLGYLLGGMVGVVAFVINLVLA